MTYNILANGGRNSKAVLRTSSHTVHIQLAGKFIRVIYSLFSLNSKQYWEVNWMQNNKQRYSSTAEQLVLPSSYTALLPQTQRFSNPLVAPLHMGPWIQHSLFPLLSLSKLLLIRKLILSELALSGHPKWSTASNTSAWLCHLLEWHQCSPPQKWRVNYISLLRPTVAHCLSHEV